MAVRDAARGAQGEVVDVLVVGRSDGGSRRDVRPRVTVPSARGEIAAGATARSTGSTRSTRPTGSTRPAGAARASETTRPANTTRASRAAGSTGSSRTTRSAGLAVVPCLADRVQAEVEIPGVLVVTGDQDGRGNESEPPGLLTDTSMPSVLGITLPRGGSSPRS